MWQPTKQSSVYHRLGAGKGIRPLLWRRLGRRESPFDKNSSRPFRITIHTESLGNLTPKEQVALDTLQDMAALEEIQLVATHRDGPLPFLDIGEIRPGTDRVP